LHHQDFDDYQVSDCHYPAIAGLMGESGEATPAFVFQK
jgi:hypothetical protein